MASILHLGVSNDTCYTYNVLPSLQHMAAAKIAIAVWDHSELRNASENLDTGPLGLFLVAEDRCHMRKCWKPIDDRAIENVHRISMPELLKRKVLGLMKPIGEGIVGWKQLFWNRGVYFLDGERYDYCTLPNKFCWTSEGTIDMKKTVQIMVKDYSLGIDLRFELACVYCLESDVKKLWPEFLERHPHIKKEKTSIFRFCVIERFWIDVMLGIEPWKSISEDVVPQPHLHEETVDVLVDALKIAMNCSYLSAVEYFWQKIADEYKSENELLSNCICETFERMQLNSACFDSFTYFNVEVGFVLLSKAHKDLLRHIIRKHGINIISCFLKWPWQGSLVKIAGHFMDYLVEDHFNAVLKNIVCKISLQYTDYDYQSLFAEFWQLFPDTHKRYVIQQCSSKWELLKNLFHTKNEQLVLMMLKEATIEELQSIIYYVEWESICPFGSHRNSGNSNKCCPGCYSNRRATKLRRRLLVFVKALVEEKTKTMEKSVSPAKKFCCRSDGSEMQ